jgi:GMP synthase-like glutamine amidotransferase
VAHRVLVIQHVPTSSLGVYGEAFDEAGDELVWLRCHEGARLPAGPDGFAGVVSLGAPHSVHEAQDPWLEAELALLRRCVEAEVPVFGICFGAQALAAALGARVYTGAVPEVGFHDLALTEAAERDPLFAGLAPTLPMFHWHGDSFELPVGAELLASSAAYENQAFRAGRSAYGMQFHAESTMELVRGWVELPATAAQLEASHGSGAADRIVADAERQLKAVNAVARQLMGRWRAAFLP